MKKWNSPSGFALRGKMEFFLSYLFLGEEELRKAAPEEELRLNEVPNFILTKYLKEEFHFSFTLTLLLLFYN